MIEFFVNPIVHAMDLIDAMDGDVAEARSCARINALNAPIDDDENFLYWVSVLRSLPIDPLQVEALQIPRSLMN